MCHLSLTLLVIEATHKAVWIWQWSVSSIHWKLNLKLESLKFDRQSQKMMSWKSVLKVKTGLHKSQYYFGIGYDGLEHLLSSWWFPCNPEQHELLWSYGTAILKAAEPPKATEGMEKLEMRVDLHSEVFVWLCKTPIAQCSAWLRASFSGRFTQINVKLCRYTLGNILRVFFSIQKVMPSKKKHRWSDDRHIGVLNWV